MLGNDLAWIVWPPSSTREAFFFPATPVASHKDRAISWSHTTGVIVTIFTKKARESCTNTSATGAAVTSGARNTIIAGTGIVVCPRCLVSAITFLGNKIIVIHWNPYSGDTGGKWWAGC